MILSVLGENYHKNIILILIKKRMLHKNLRKLMMVNKKTFFSVIYY